jgi:hypothetical protein
VTSEVGVIDVVTARPFIAVDIKPKAPGKRPVKALRLNVQRVVIGQPGKYHLVFIPYTREEMIGRRQFKTKKVYPFKPDKAAMDEETLLPVWAPYQEVDLKCGHLQFVREDRLETHRSESPWAG